MSGFCFRLRRQLVALTECCDRWTIDCGRLLGNAPESLANSREQIHQLRQFYRQQSLTVDRLQAIGLSIGIVRSFFRGKQ
jgi:hypothetical protein